MLGHFYFLVIEKMVTSNFFRTSATFIADLNTRVQNLIKGLLI